MKTYSVDYSALVREHGRIDTLTVNDDETIEEALEDYVQSNDLFDGEEYSDCRVESYMEIKEGMKINE